MARERKPVELKLLQGNPSKDPELTNVKSPISTTGKPKPPPGLKGEAFAEWCRITDFLETIGRIEVVDYAALIVYCQSWATYVAASEALESHGPLVNGRDGGLVKNPAAQIAKDAADMMLKYGARFGFTPKDRQNLGVAPSERVEDELGDFLAG